MIGVDTNILARYFCDDPQDPEAARQRPLARRVMVESKAIFVPLTVVLEFERVMRGFYELSTDIFCQTLEHLLGMPNVTIERWEAVKDALDLHRQGLDFADALHWTCAAACERFVTFDNRRFVRRARQFVRTPEVALPT
jgi:predicted nucleic-acid-binding protein